MNRANRSYTEVWGCKSEESACFPQVFGITQFDECESFGKVIIQGAIEDQGIGNKVVCADAVAAMGVGKEDEPGVGC